MQTRIVLFGAGGHAKVVLEAIRAEAPADIAVLDDAAPAIPALIDLPLRGGREWLANNWLEAEVVPAIGSNRARSDLMAWLEATGRGLATIVHPAATLSSSATLGAGSFIAAGAVVNAEAQIGIGVIINTLASVDHDCEIGEAAHIAPGSRLCGGVRIGPRALIGTAAAVIPGVSIGADAIIGAGSVVVRDVPAGAKVAGCPARQI